MKRTFWIAALCALLLLPATFQQLAHAQGFSTPVKVSIGNIYVQDPQVAVDSTGTSIFWTANSRREFLFRRTLDGGSSFADLPSPVLPWRELTGLQLACFSIYPYEPCWRRENLHVDGQGNIHVVANWYPTGGYSGMVYARSTDHGATFSTPVILDEEDGSDPEILVDGTGAINVVWTNWDDEIMFRRSTDSGQSFSRPTRVSQSGFHAYGQRAVLDSAGIVHIVWIEEFPTSGSHTVRYAFVKNGLDGPVPSTPVVLSSGFSPYEVRVAIDSQGHIYVVWSQGPCKDCGPWYAIEFAHSKDSGRSFSEPIAVAQSGVDPLYNPAIVVDDQGRVRIVWEVSGTALLFRSSVDWGQTFTAPVRVAEASQSKARLNPNLLLDGAGNLNVLWSDMNAAGGFDVKFARSTDAGASFSLPQVLSSTTVSNIWPDPQMAADQQGNVNIVWLQSDPSSPGSHGVYLARLSLGSTPTGEDITVQPVDPVSGTTPVTITFGDVTQPGETTVTTTSTGQPPPTGLKLGNPPTYYEISTTASVSGSITICINYTGVSYGNENNLKLFHNDGTNWNDVTTSLDTENDIICGEVPSLSPFAIFEPANQTPTANAGLDQTVTCATVAGTSVTLDGTGSTDPDGDTLTYTWTGLFAEGDGTVTGATPSITLPLGTHTITLTVDDGHGGRSTDTVQLTIGVGVMGVPPPLNELVSDGWFVPLANRAFRAGSTLPLRMVLHCGGTPLTANDVAPPRITELVRNGDELNLAILDLDAGQANDEGASFRFANGLWIFNLSTKGWATGTYVLAIEMPDHRTFQAAFVLR